MVCPDLRFKPRLAVLSEEQMEQIHLATLELLERTGVQLTHRRALEILHGAGARVDGKQVHIPAWMVEDAIRTAPCRVVSLRNARGSSATIAASPPPWPMLCPTIPG